MFSSARKEIIIKAMIQAIPNYVVGCLNFQRRSLIAFIVMQQNFGGDQLRRKGKFAGASGRSYVRAK